jgi:signal transduction histidine kinase
LLRKDKLAAVGELSAGIAHEIRNPLGIIKSSAEMLRSKIKNKLAIGSMDHRLAEVIVEESNRLNNIIINFLTFARPQSPHFEKCNIPNMLDDSLSIINSQNSFEESKITITKSYLPNLPIIYADRHLLHQVFLNILFNACQAMPDGGSLRISTRHHSHSVEISLQDTGEGISVENQKKIFDPFFTTKEDGVGLGLSIVHRIIEAHKGNIKVESEPGEGTKLVLTLPVVDTQGKEKLS